MPRPEAAVSGEEKHPTVSRAIAESGTFFSQSQFEVNS
jgi:hypothetical protein